MAKPFRAILAQNGDNEMRANGIATYAFADGVMSWTFADGKKVSYNIGNEPTYANADEFGRDLSHNGAKQKIADAGALQSGATVANKFQAMSECAERLTARQWNAERVGGGTSLPLFDVLTHYYGGKKTADEIRAFIKPLDAAAKRKMYYAERVKKARLHVENERAKTITGGDELLAGFDAA